MTQPAPGGPAPRGIVRLLNTADGRALCLAGDVDATAVDAFLRRYGREPVRIDAVDTGSVTALSAEGEELVTTHLDAAWQAGRPVAVHLSPIVERLLTARGRGTSAARRVGGAPEERRDRSGATAPGGPGG